MDIHAHIIPEAVLGSAGPHGPEMAMTESGSYTIRASSLVGVAKTIAHKAHEAGEGGEDPRGWMERLTSPTRRLAEMDEHGIDAMVVSPSPPLFMYGIEREYAVPYVKKYNDELARYCSTDPGRLFFLAALPLQDLKESVVEARRAIRELGARGVYVGATDLGDRELDDPDLWPLFEALIEADLPLSIHPGPVSFFNGPHERYRERPALGFPAQETHAIFLLIAGGVLDTFPDLKVCISHGGGFFPFQYSRIDDFLQVADDSKAKRPVVEYFQHLYFDCLLHDVRARRLLLDVAGIDHVMMGSNYAGLDSVDGIALVKELNLPEQQQTRLIGGNAKRLYKLR
ncbi:MAG TPA: amidohydrolase family protein [Amycolatopsis sp.]|uniref:amidohydrolase family protein n=1 Tax=Amycolatopsis sp. TaxID=37632 RepID=UPI002B4876C3|nr:amidohydrolase family protein [Amycolatopsis sp.]HKS47023.1 amidohydrolase family protein [Amycolatopsis sp.]